MQWPRRSPAPHGVAYIAADMSSGEDCRALIAKAKDKLGSVDVLVPNAGVQHVPSSTTLT